MCSSNSHIDDIRSFFQSKRKHEEGKSSRGVRILCGSQLSHINVWQYGPTIRYIVPIVVASPSRFAVLMRTWPQCSPQKIGTCRTLCLVLIPNHVWWQEARLCTRSMFAKKVLWLKESHAAAFDFILTPSLNPNSCIMFWVNFSIISIIIWEKI